MRYSVAVWDSAIGSQRLRKQVDDRHAAQNQRIIADRALQFRNAAVQIDKNLHPVAAGYQRLGLQTAEIQEQELLREGEVFRQQPEAGEAAGRPGEQRLIRREPDRLDRAGWNQHRSGVIRAIRQCDADSVPAQQLIQRQRNIRRRAQEEAQPIDAEGRERCFGGGTFQPDAQHADRAGRARIGRRRQRQSGQPDTFHLHRPKRGRIDGAKPACFTTDRFAVERQVDRNLARLLQIRLAEKLDDRTGRHGAR